MSEEVQKTAAKEDKELNEFEEELKKGGDFTPVATPPKEEKKYKICDIDWDQVPYIFSLKVKIEKALELKLEHISGEDSFLVKNGAEPHTVTENSCDCKDWEVNGNNINPCKHIIRVHYTDEDLEKMVGIVAPGEIIKAHVNKKEEKKTKQTEKEGEIVKTKEGEGLVSIGQDEEELLMIPDISPALPEIGKIKIGYLGEKRTKGGRLLPEKMDHFEIGTLIKDNEGRVDMDEKMTDAIEGDKTELDVSLCYDTPALNFPTFYAAFTQSKLACMGNGRTAWQRQEDGERKEITCSRKECKLAQDKRCKPYGRMSVILTMANRIGGTYVFRTTSWNSISNILSSMAFIYNKTGGILAGIPLKLKLRKASVLPNGLTQRVNIYVANLEYAGTMEELKRDAITEIKRRRTLGMNMRDLEQIQKGAIKEHTQIEAEAEAEEIGDEFYGEGAEE